MKMEIKPTCDAKLAAVTAHAAGAELKFTNPTGSTAFAMENNALRAELELTRRLCEQRDAHCSALEQDIARMSRALQSIRDICAPIAWRDISANACCELVDEALQNAVGMP